MNVMLEYDGGAGTSIDKNYNNINIEYDGGGAATTEYSNENNIVNAILNKKITRIIGGK